MSRKAQSQTVALQGRKDATEFALAPDAETRAAMAERLGLLALRKLTLAGRILPASGRDWHLEARLGATVVQPCGVTLAPVTTRIDEDVTRRYLADLPATPHAEGDETEMPEDTDVEPLPRAVDLLALAEEALSLALPMFPRAPDAGFDGAQVTEPGKRAMTDADARPFAQLARLRDRADGDD